MSGAAATAYSDIAQAAADPRVQAVLRSPVPPVVVFPSSHAVAMSVIRALQDESIPILAVDFKPQAAGLYSRFVVPLLLPDLYRDAATFESCMLELGSRFAERPVLFLVDDEDLFRSLRHQDRWERVYRLPLSRWSIVEGIVDKGRMYRRLQVLGWSGCPATWFPDSLEALDRLRGEIAFPCIIKPTYSTAFRRRFGVKAKRFESFDPLRAFAADVFAANIAFVVQEFIPGGEDLLVTYAAYSNDNGEVIASSTGRKLHQFPPDFGTCRLAESIADDGLDRIGREFLRILRYRGISLTEFKRAPTGDFKLIELNPRPGDWPERLAQVCGANLVLVAYKETLGERVAPHSITRFGRKWANLPEDFYYCVRGYRLLGWPEAHRGFFGWLSDIHGLASDAFFDWRDPWPAWIRFKGMCREFARRERSLTRDVH
jgi:predicted ATP-grasp superfamily ATP-dependent carboligase